MAEEVIQSLHLPPSQLNVRYPAVIIVVAECLDVEYWPRICLVGQSEKGDGPPGAFLDEKVKLRFWFGVGTSFGYAEQDRENGENCLTGSHESDRCVG